MFSHADVQYAWRTGLRPSAARLTIIEYSPRDFGDGGGEDWLYIGSSPRSAYRSDLEFWIAFAATDLDAEGWDFYLSEGETRDILSRLYERSIRELIRDFRPTLPEDVLSRGQPEEVLWTRIHYCDEAIIATFADHYVAVRFYSTG